MQVCEVCVESINKSNRTLVKCKCEYVCCKDCAKQYLLTCNTAKCMNCNIDWDRSFLYDNFEKVFLDTKYKVHRENVLLEKELILLPEAQVQIDNDLLIKQNKEHIAQLKKEIRYLQFDIHDLQDEINDVKYSNPIKSSYTTRCPKIDCRGYLNHLFICQICNVECCKDCKEIKENNHNCDDNILKNLKLIHEDSVNCPCCNILVHRISGCEVLFCSPLYKGCGTFFNNTTRRIERYSHNPEHDLYKKELENGFVPREKDDILCGRELDSNFIKEMKMTFKLYYDTNEHYYINNDNEEFFTIYTIRSSNYYNFDDRIQMILVNVIHNLKYNKLSQFNNYIIDNMDLRKQYIIGMIDKDKMKFLLQKRDKNNNKNKEIYEILTTFIACITEIFYILKDDIENCKPEELNKIILKFNTETETLRLHTNECLMKIKRCYNCYDYHLKQDFQFF